MSQRKMKYIAHSIPDGATEDALKSRFLKSMRMKALEGVTTTNNYGGGATETSNAEGVTDGAIFDTRLLRTKLFTLKEHDVNAIKWRVLGCLDPKNWVVAIAERVVLKGATDSISTTDPYNFMCVQIKPNVADTHGKVTAFQGGYTV